MSKVFEVYVCKSGEDILYIGQGKLGRHEHCNSGISHVYGLNRLHFGKVDVIIEIDSLHDLKEEAVKRESDLIAKHKPKFNKVNNGDTALWGLNNLSYMNNRCNEHLKCGRDHAEEMSYEDQEYWLLDNFNHLAHSNPLYFKDWGGYYKIDQEKNILDVNTEILRDYFDLKFYNRNEVGVFCLATFMGGKIENGWRNDKVTLNDLDDLLKTCLYVIEYT